MESSTTIAPAHRLASNILGPVHHCLCSQSYFVTRLTVRDPVGEFGSDSSPPKYKNITVKNKFAVFWNYDENRQKLVSIHT